MLRIVQFPFVHLAGLNQARLSGSSPLREASPIHSSIRIGIHGFDQPPAHFGGTAWC